MTQFKFGDWREKSLPRYVIDDQGNILGIAASPVHVTGTVAIAASETDDTQTFAFDETTGAMVTIGVPHHEIHEGETFITTYKTPDGTPLSDNATIEFIVVCAAKEAHMAARAAVGGDFEAGMFEGSTHSDGTAQEIFNKKRSSMESPTLTVIRDPTVTDDGTLIENEFIPGGTGPRAFGGAAQQRAEWILAPTRTYLFRITNRAGNNQPGSLALEWYEETV